jgi:hypothetical protein
MRGKLYNSRQYMNFSTRLLRWLAVAFASGACAVAHAALDASQPTAELAKRIAAIAGPGPAKLTVNSRSSLTPEEVVAIRKLLERDLRALGVISQGAASDSGGESATAIRVTLSANSSHGLWVAEVREGTDLHVAMVEVDLPSPAAAETTGGITLGKTLLWRQSGQVLDLLILPSPSGANRRMIVLEPERIVSYSMPSGGSDANAWKQDREFAIAHARPFPRDVRGRLLAGAATGPVHLFDAYLPGVQCSGEERDGQLAVNCEDGDDPWPLPGSSSLSPDAEPDSPAPRGVEQKAFYNSAKNYFTGVLSPGFGLRLPPFYDAAVLTRATGAAVILSSIDGKVFISEHGGLKRVAGTRDWGSDLSALVSACGSGTQLLTSASGAGTADSLRAYEVAGAEASPVSPALDIDGAVMAIWPSSVGRDATVVVRKSEDTSGSQGPEPREEYEVYSVAPHCN